MKRSFINKALCVVITIGFAFLAVSRSFGGEPHKCPSYELANPQLALFLDSLVQKNGTDIFGEIMYWEGRFSLLTILVQKDIVRNHLRESDVQKLEGVLQYHSILWYVYDAIPAANIFKNSGDSTELTLCQEYSIIESDTIMRPCSSDDRDDMYDGVELIFDLLLLEGTDSVYVAENIRKLTPQELEKYELND